MSSLNVLPFPLGSLFPTDSATDYAHLEGKEYWIENFDPSDGEYLHAGPIKVKCVRQAQSAFNIKPKRLVTYKSTARGRQVDGYAIVNDVESFPTDPYMPSAGAAENDLFYIVIDGLVLCERQIGDTSADIAVGDLLTALTTSATSGSATAGRLAPFVITGSSTATDFAFVVKAVHGLVARALSASATSAGTTPGQAILTQIKPWR